jgi:hypothetical protein
MTVPSAVAEWAVAGVCERDMVAHAAVDALRDSGVPQDVLALAGALDQAVAAAPGGLAIRLDYVAAQLLEHSQRPPGSDSGGDWVPAFMLRLLRVERQMVVAALNTARWADGASAMHAKRLLARARAYV